MRPAICRCYIVNGYTGAPPGVRRYGCFSPTLKVPLNVRVPVAPVVGSGGNVTLKVPDTRVAVALVIDTVPRFDTPAPPQRLGVPATLDTDMYWTGVESSG